MSGLIILQQIQNIEELIRCAKSDNPENNISLNLNLKWEINAHHPNEKIYTIRACCYFGQNIHTGAEFKYLDEALKFIEVTVNRWAIKIIQETKKEKIQKKVEALVKKQLMEDLCKKQKVKSRAFAPKK